MSRDTLELSGVIAIRNKLAVKLEFDMHGFKEFDSMTLSADVMEDIERSDREVMIDLRERRIFAVVVMI